MEWSIPIQSFDVTKLKVGSMGHGVKPIVPLSYVDGESRFPSLSLLLPILTIYSYDPSTGRLMLSLSNSIITKLRLQALQDVLLNAVNHQQRHWFPSEKSKTAEDIRSGYQAMIDGDNLHLYYPLPNTSVAGGANPFDLQVYSGGEWTRSIKPSQLRPGTRVRIVLRIQGLSFHQHPVTGTWTGRFRLQHRILTMFLGTPTPTISTLCSAGEATKCLH